MRVPVKGGCILGTNQPVRGFKLPPMKQAFAIDHLSLRSTGKVTSMMSISVICSPK